MVQYNSSILPHKKSKLVAASTVRWLLVSFTLFVLGLYGIAFIIYITTTPSPLTDGDQNNFVKATTTTKTDWETEERELILSRDSMECLTDDDNNNSSSSSSSSGRKECCFAWNVNLDEWRTYHPTWGAVRMEKHQYCITKLYGKKAKFLQELHNLQFGIVHENDKKKTQQTPQRNCSNVLQNLQISSGMGRALREMMDGFITAHQQHRPYQLNRLLNTSRWMYAPADTSSWAYCTSMSINCYILPFSNCITTYGIDEKTQYFSGTSTPGYFSIYEYLMRFNHKTMIHIQEQINNVSNSNLLLNSHDHGGGSSSSAKICTVIHVRRGDSGQPRSVHRKYVSLAEYVRVGNITPSVPVLILTDDQTTIYEASTYYPEYNWIYMDRPRVNLTYGGFEGLIPSGDEAAEFVAIYTEMHLASHCNKVVHGVSGFIRELKTYAEVSRQSMNLPSQTYHAVPGSEIVNNTEKKRCQKLGTHYCAERMIEEIYRNAAEGLKNRTRRV